MTLRDLIQFAKEKPEALDYKIRINCLDLDEYDEPEGEQETDADHIEWSEDKTYLVIQ